jgi:VWFA-related protein
LEFVENFIDEEYDEKAEWAVMAVASGTDTLQPFTTNKEQIRSALLSARQRPTNTQQRQIDRGLLDDPVRKRLRDDPSSGYDFSESARFQSQEQTARNLAAMKNIARAIIQTCRAYGASSGRKAILLITGGMELNTSFGAFDNTRDRQVTDAKLDMERVLNTMVREANAANFKIYIIKAGSLESHVPQHEVSNRTAGTGGSAKNPFFGEGFTRSSDSSDIDSSSLTLALQTGGEYFPSAEIRKSVERIDDDLSNFYSLAYVPQSPEDGQYHHLQVKVKRPGVNVRHREGYVAINTDQQLEQMLRAPLTFAKDKGTLPVTLELGAPDTKDKNKPIIPIVAAMPIQGITLIPRESTYLGRVHVYLTIYDQQGTNVGFHHQVQDLRIPTAQMQQATGQPFRYVMKVAMKKGNYTFVVTLRDDISGEIGTALQELRI